MPSELRVTIHFLQPYSHGRGEDGMPEWPPSPLRLFQALVASSVGRAVDAERRARSVEALRWLERQAAPEIVAPPAVLVGAPYRLFVPDNIGDKVARGWSAGRDANLADYRTEKDVRPMRLEGEAVHYVFQGVEGLDAHLGTLRTAARSITHVGWGIDMVAGDASDVTAVIEGERWIPGRHGGSVLRRPVAGTFDALEHKHAQFLRRFDGGTFRPVSPLSAFATESYARATDVAPRPIAAFRLLEPITSDRLSLDPPRRSRDVAAWTRHAVAEVCEGWPFGSTRTLVHGHVQEPNAESDGLPRARFSLLPLPTINPRGRVEGIARVMVVAPPGYDEQLRWVRAHLAGHDLTWEGEVVAFLDPLPHGDWVLRQYTAMSDRWSTVTPVVLPGHDDGSPQKAEHLLRKAFLQAGFEPEVVDSVQELEWRNVGFRAGLDLASRYLRPDKVRGPMFHVRVRFARPLVGPMAIGSGRHRGMGVFAVE